MQNSFVKCLTQCNVTCVGLFKCHGSSVRNAIGIAVSFNLAKSDVIFYDGDVVLKFKESKTNPFKHKRYIQLHKSNRFICKFLTVHFILYLDLNEKFIDPYIVEPNLTFYRTYFI